MAPNLKIILTAKTPESRARGLKQIKTLGPNETALFIFSYDSEAYFWNKGVEYPIDIAFFDKEKNLIYKTSMEANQTKSITSTKPYRYVLETNVDWFKNNKIPDAVNLKNLIGDI